jgi:ABC-type glycerol-3-phosphate transport system substrate-binding protein
MRKVALCTAWVALLFGLIGCAQSSEVTELSMFHWDFDLDKESPIYAAIAGRLGVDINPLTAPWTDWPDKLNVMIASGAVPDIFVTYGPGDPDSFERLARDGLLLPLGPFLHDHPHIKDRLAGRENQKWQGEYYAAPVSLPKSDHIGMIRGDWLDRLNLQVPATVEDLYEVAKAFKQELGIYPISSSPPHTAGFFWLNFLFYAYGGGWDTWIQTEDGSYVMCWVSEGNREALRFIRRLYLEDLLDPEFFANTDSQKMDRFLSGRAGIVFHNTISLYVDRMASVDPSARIELFSPVAGPEGQRGQWAMDGFFTAVSIHSRISDQKRDKALDLLDFLYSAEGLELLRYGVEGIHWRTDNGRREPLLPFDRKTGAYRRLREVDASASLRDFIELGDIWIPEWDRNAGVVRRAVASGEVYGKVPLFLYDKTEAGSTYRKTLTDMVLQEYVRLVRSQDFDRDWHDFVRRWYEAGGEEMTLERNAEPPR